MSRAGGQTDIEPEARPQEKTKREVQDSASRGILLAVLLWRRRGENSHWPVPPSPAVSPNPEVENRHNLLYDRKR